MIRTCSNIWEYIVNNIYYVQPDIISDSFCPAKIEICRTKLCPPNLVPNFCPANFYNNMGHKTTFSQINGLKMVGNWFCSLFGQTHGLLRQIQTFLPSLDSGQKVLICPSKPQVWPKWSEIQFTTVFRLQISPNVVLFPILL